MKEKRIHPARKIVGGLILLMGILIFVQSYLGFVTNQMMTILKDEAVQAEAAAEAAEVTEEAAKTVSVDFFSAVGASFQYVAGIATLLVALLLTIAGLMVLIGGHKSKRCNVAAFITAIAAGIGIVMLVPALHSLPWCITALVLAVSWMTESKFH